MVLFSLSTNTIVGIVVGSVIGLLVIILICALIGMYNTLVKMRNNCEEAFATIDVYLKKRYDLIPNLVETVKGYAAHESGTLEKVIAARNMAMNSTNNNERIAAENVLSGTLKTLFSVIESYPNLKADAQFLNLQNQLQAIENDLAQARKYYNGVCKGFNTKIQVFPSNLVAGMMRLEKCKYFELDSDEERKNVKVSFNA